MPTSTFQEQGAVTLVPVASLPEERRCQSTVHSGKNFQNFGQA